MVCGGSATMTSGGVDLSRRIEKRRRLPKARAVVGAAMITAAGLAVFVAYLDAVGEPSTRFVVAREEIVAGTVIADREVAEQLFGSAPLSLVEAVADRAYRVEELDTLVGQTIAWPLSPGELLQRGAVYAAEDGSDRFLLSFALPVADAVGGRLTPGGTVDVLATSRTGPVPRTSYIVQAVPVIDVTESGGASVTVTVAVAEQRDALRLGHAVQTSGVFLVRSFGDRAGPPPSPYPDEDVLAPHGLTGDLDG